MNDRTATITEKEARTVLAVFGELQKMPYDKLNTFLGSVTIDEMSELQQKLRLWYYECDDNDELRRKLYDV